MVHFTEHMYHFFKNTDFSAEVELGSTQMSFYNCTCLFRKKSQTQPDRHKNQILKGTTVPRSPSSCLKGLCNSCSLSNSSAFASSKEPILDSNCALLQWLYLFPTTYTNILLSIFLPITVLWTWIHYLC